VTGGEVGVSEASVFSLGSAMPVQVGEWHTAPTPELLRGDFVNKKWEKIITHEGAAILQHLVALFRLAPATVNGKAGVFFRLRAVQGLFVPTNPCFCFAQEHSTKDEAYLKVFEDIQASGPGGHHQPGR